MIVKTYEDEYRDCQEAFLKLMGENTRLKAEIERKDEAISKAIDLIDDRNYGGARFRLSLVEKALLNKEESDE